MARKALSADAPTVSITFKAPRDLREWAVEQAAADGRDLSGWLRRQLEHLRAAAPKRARK